MFELKDLKELGSDMGYPISAFGRQIYLRGAVLAFLANTPVSNLGVGFKESVGGARRKCCHCMATYETMREHFKEEEFTWRCKDSLREYYSKIFGVNQRSILQDALF